MSLTDSLTDAQPFFLPRVPGQPHRREFKNVRPPHDESDFLLYYDVLSDPWEHRYDFRKAVKHGDEPCEGGRDRDGMGLACDKVYLRETSDLP